MIREELIEELHRLCDETDVETSEATQGWLVSNIRAALARFEKAQAPTDDEREALREALGSVLSEDTLDCTRVWEAWHYGTMTEDDFIPVMERSDEIIAAILAAGFRRTAQDDQGPAASCHLCVGAGGYEDHDGTWVECSCQRPHTGPRVGVPMIARLEVTRGSLTEFPLAEKVRGGWQNGVTFYPDAEVTKFTPLAARPAQTDPPTIQFAARRIGKSQALIDSMLAQANEHGIRVEVVYPQSEPTDAQCDAITQALIDHDARSFTCYDHDRVCCPCGVHDMARLEWQRHRARAAFTAGQEEQP